MIEVWFDGCCEPRNPGGNAGYGAAIYRGGTLLHEISGYIPASPRTSNNVAEYLALQKALEWLAAQRTSWGSPEPTSARSNWAGGSRAKGR